VDISIEEVLFFLYNKSMPQKIKKLFSPLFRKQTLLLPFIFLILFGFLFPSQPAQAQQTWEERGTTWGFIKWITGIEAAGVALSWAGSAAKGTAYWIFTLLFSILGTINVAFAGLAIAILNYVLSPNFITLSYTNPANNPIIAAGLDVTRNFVNMILVLILIYIALATILRLAGYETKKLLITFVIVALLVNFAPLLCGLIVDATNIVMNYFTKNISTFLSFSNRLATLWGDFLNTPPWAETQKLAQVFFQSLAIAVFGAFAGLIFLLFSVVFLVRYIAIWVLVILSPLAFACYILPATKKYWTLWWNQFLQWSFIGVTMGFFLYLATILLSKTESIFKNPNIGGLESPVNQLFVYLVPLAFLYLGFLIGLSTSAFGASSVMGLTKRTGRKVGGWVGGKAAAGIWRKAEEKGQIREKVGAITKKWEEKPFIRAFIPQAMRKYAEMRPSIEEARKKLSVHGSPELGHRAAVGDIYGKDAAAGLLELVERGDSNDWFKQHMMQYGIDPGDKDAMERLHDKPEYRQKMARLLKIALSSGYHNTILRGSPRLAEFAVDAGLYKELAGLPREEMRKKAIKRATEEARPQHVKNFEQEDIENEDVIEGFMTRGRDIWQAVAGVKRGHLKPLEVIGKMYKKQAGFSEMNEEELKKISKEQLTKTWENFEKTSRETGKNGIFLYLDSARAKEQGWTREEIIKMATGQQIILPKEKKKTSTVGDEVRIEQD